MYGKRRNYGKKRAVKKRTTYKKRSTVSSAVKSYVKRTIHTNIENKKVSVVGQGITVGGCSAVTGMSFNVSAIPYSPIVQGITQDDRIGNEIKPRSLFFNFVVRPGPRDVTNNTTPIPQDVIIMIGKVKNSQPIQPIPTDFQRLFQSGSNNIAPYNTTLDLLQNVNSDYFTVYKTMRFKVGNSTLNNAGVTPDYQHYANNDYKFNHIRRINITKLCPKTLKFNDTTNQPTNAGLWIWAWSVPADGRGQNAVIPSLIDYTLQMEYEDA